MRETVQSIDDAEDCYCETCGLLLMDIIYYNGRPVAEVVAEHLRYEPEHELTLIGPDNVST